ncbi:hypothetical protein ACFQ2B_06555 [Streptomyces stramineus]
MPCELSLAWADGKAGVRMSLESPRGDARTRMADGTALTRRLAGRPGVAIDRYLRVEDLFTADDPQGFFAVAHAVAFTPGGPRGTRSSSTPRWPHGSRPRPGRKRPWSGSAWSAPGAR